MHGIKSVPAFMNLSTWFKQSGQQDPRESFDELTDSTFDFSAFVMNQLNIQTLTPELLAGPTFKLMKGTCKSLTELEYFCEEVVCHTISSLQSNNDLGISSGGLCVKPKVLYVRVVIQRRVEDLQLGVESYQKKLNLTKPDTQKHSVVLSDIEDSHGPSDAMHNPLPATQSYEKWLVRADGGFDSVGSKSSQNQCSYPDDKHKVIMKVSSDMFPIDFRYSDTTIFLEVSTVLKLKKISRKSKFKAFQRMLFRELLPFVKLYSGDIVSRRVLTLCIPSPFVIVIVVMVAVVGSWSGPD
ncbi:hypothetical protein Tco_0015805 [Tanacetum coccineum]